MKNREGKGPPAADLLVCFPSRAHLSLMPKPICSPARPSDSSTLHRHNRRPSHHHHHPRKSTNRFGGGASHGSPLLWAKSKHNNAADISEPTSPKVTCAGQIKVRTKPNSCKNWQSVMEEIERLHKNRKNKKRAAWIDAFGFKKDVMQFLTCLRNIRFDFRCFGAIPSAEITSDEDEDDDEDEEDANNYRQSRRISKGEIGGDDQASRAVFSKWFMILQEDNLSKEMIKTEERSRGKVIRPYCDKGMVDDNDDTSCERPPPPPPPPNALLLMRCRSAPAKSWLEEREEEEKERRETEKEDEVKKTEFSEFPCEIAKEIRVVGGIQDKVSRSRSCKR